MRCEQLIDMVSVSPRPLTPEKLAQVRWHAGECVSCGRWLAVLFPRLAALRPGMTPEPAVPAGEAVRSPADEALGPRCSLLVVDDEYVRGLLRALLGDEFDIRTADSAEAARSLLTEDRIDVVLARQGLPRMTGVELLEWARWNSPQTVRLLTSGSADLEYLVDAINRGQVFRFLVKPWRAEEVQATLREAARAALAARSQRETLAEVCQRNRDLARANHELLRHKHLLERLGFLDPLTGLPDRRAMFALCERELRHRNSHLRPLAVGEIDVDHMNRVNMHCMLPGGDKVLTGLATCLLGALRPVDFLGRVTGDSFLLIAAETGPDEAADLAEQIRATVEAGPFSCNGRRIPVTVSIGLALVEAGVPATDEQVRLLAHVALDEAKRAGRNRVAVHRLQPGW